MKASRAANLLSKSDELLYIYTDQQFNIREVNETFLKRFRIQENSCLGTPFHKVVTGFEKNKLLQAKESFKKNPKLTVKIEICVQHELSENWFRWEISPDTTTENGIHIMGYDITQFKEREKKLLNRACLLDNITEAVVVTDESFLIKSMNPAAEAIYEITEKEALGQPAGKILNHKLVNDTKENVLETINHFGKWQGKAIRIQKNGNPIRLQSSVTKVFTDNKTEAAIVAVSRIIENDFYEKMVQEIDEYAIFLLSEDGKIKDWNKGAEKINEYRKEEIIGEHFSIFYTDDDIKKKLPQKLLNIARKNGKAIHEGWRIKKGGNVFWGRVVITALHNEFNQVTGFSKFAYDLTNKRLADIAKEDEIKKIHTAIDKIGDNVWEYDAVRNKMSFSKKMNNLLGYANKTTGGINFWWKIVHKEDLHLVTACNKMYKQGLQDSHYLEYRVLDKNRNIKWVLDRGVVIEKSETGVPLRIIGTHTNITRQKLHEDILRKNEEKLRKTNEKYDYINKATSDSIWDWDIQNDIIQRGNGFKSLFGYEEETSSFRKRLKLIHPKNRNEVKNSLFNLLHSGKNIWHHEYRFRCADGSYKTILDRVFIIRNEQNLAIRAIGAMQDVTQQRELEKQLVEKEIKQKRDIILAIINAQEKERKELADELHDNVNQILSSSKLMLEVAGENEKLAGELLNKSRFHLQEAIDEIRQISHNLSPSILKDISIQDAIRELVESINKTKKVYITYSFHTTNKEANIPDEIELSVLRIAQEQLNNIIKYAGTRDVRIKLSINKKQICLLVKDNGVGFDTTKVKRGLGLNNIFNRAEYYHGTAVLNTREGKGCVLLVKIPY